MARPILLLVPAVLLICSLGGCGKSPAGQPGGAANSSASQPDSEGSDSALALVHDGTAITDEEALALGRRIELAVRQADANAFNADMDWAAFRELVLADIPADTKETANFRRGLNKGMENATPRLTAQLLDQMSSGSYVLIGVRQRPEGKRLLFRLQLPSGALNYHELCLARQERVRVVDMYIYASGELLSETMERTFLVTMPPENLGLIGRLRGADKAALEHLLVMQRMTQAVKSGQGREGLAEFAKLPRHLQETKLVQLMRVMATGHIDDAQYLAAVEEYERLFPDDPSIALLSIDGYILRKEWQMAHETIDRLDKALGGDPYLQIVHGNAHVMEGDFEQAQQRAETVLAASPRDENAHWLLVSVSLGRRDYAQTARLLAKIRDDLRIEIGDLTQVPDYADFVRSPEYDEWKRSILK